MNLCNLSCNLNARGLYISLGEMAMIAYPYIIFCERLLTHMTLHIGVKFYPIVSCKICHGNVSG